MRFPVPGPHELGLPSCFLIYPAVSLSLCLDPSTSLRVNVTQPSLHPPPIVSHTASVLRPGRRLTLACRSPASHHTAISTTSVTSIHPDYWIVFSSPRPRPIPCLVPDCRLCLQLFVDASPGTSKRRHDFDFGRPFISPSPRVERLGIGANTYSDDTVPVATRTTSITLIPQTSRWLFHRWRPS